MNPTLFFRLLILTAFLSVPCTGAGKDGERKIRYDFTHTLQARKRMLQTRMILSLPVSEPGKQEIHEITYSPEPTKILEKDGRKYGVFNFKNSKPPFQVRLQVDATLYAHDPGSFPPAGTEVKPLTEKELETWTRPETHQEFTSPEVQKMAQEIPSDEDREKTVALILKQVTSHMKYSGFEDKDLGVKEAVRTGKGDCTEYSDLFVSLCRAKGIPARSRLCIVPDSKDTPLHSIAEVFIEEKGWVTYDPLYRDQRWHFTQRLPNRYLYYSLIRNDPDMMGFFSDKAYFVWGKDRTTTYETRLKIFELKNETLTPIKTAEY